VTPIKAPVGALIFFRSPPQSKFAILAATMPPGGSRAGAVVTPTGTTYTVAGAGTVREDHPADAGRVEVERFARPPK